MTLKRYLHWARQSLPALFIDEETGANGIDNLVESIATSGSASRCTSRASVVVVFSRFDKILTLFFSVGRDGP